MFPKEFLEKNFCFFYSFKRKTKTDENNWSQLLDEWKKLREDLEITAVKSKRLVDKLVFYFVDGGNFIKIYDKRSINNVRIYILNADERKIFLSCSDISTYGELKQKHTDIKEPDLKNILQDFEENKIVFKENDRYLTLPINLKNYCANSYEENKQKIQNICANTAL